MSLFGGVISISGITFLMFCLFAITAVGYMFGRITIKGVNLGTAGVFIIALLFGAFFYEPLTKELVVKSTEGETIDYVSNALKIVENLGLILFVTSVGFIAGPKFFSNMKKNFKSYVLIGLIVIIAGGLSAVACIFIGRGIGGTDNESLTAMIVGLLSGSLTSTPAFSAAKATVATEALQDIVTVGHGISYIFGVVGVVLFVQLVPKFAKANMEEERAKLVQVSDGEEKKYTGKLIDLDGFGLAPFALAAIIGTFVGMIKIPLSGEGLSGTTFSLTTTGGCLLMSLIFGHFSRIGKISIMPQESTLKVFRELGLMLFLIGAGIAGGAKFVQYFDIMYFVYGVIMTIAPMLIGFVFAKYVLKLSLLNNLGSITG
ncbi:MAG: permease, partial [Lachnospiraceae bacterium]|nr:permease [Lachnospiraceae bacterium]